METVSTVPACLDALVGFIRAALPEVQVVDGQPVGDIEPDVVCVGFTGNPGEASVEDTRTQEQLTFDPDHESYDIACVASSWLGHETDAQVVRNRVYGFVNVVAAEIAKDQTLGHVVMRARLSADQFAQAQSDRGAIATVHFTIHVDAMTGAA